MTTEEENWTHKKMPITEYKGSKHDTAENAHHLLQKKKIRYKRKMPITDIKRKNMTQLYLYFGPRKCAQNNTISPDPLHPIGL